MSWVQGRRPPMGDPGLFSVLGKVVGGIANVATGGLAGTVYNTAKAAIATIAGGKRAGASGTGTMQLATLGGPSAGRTAPITPQAVTLPGGAIIRADSVKVSGTSIAGGLYSSGQATFYGPQVGAPGQPTGQQMCGDGRIRSTHLNRSGYHLKSGQYVAPGTKCVANRRRNPLNPRALSRAMSRVHGAQKAIKTLVRFESVSRGGKVIVKRPARRK